MLCTEKQAAEVGKGVMRLHLLKNIALTEISSLTSVRLGEVGSGAFEPWGQDKSQDKDAVTTEACLCAWDQKCVTAGCWRGSNVIYASVRQRNEHK